MPRAAKTGIEISSMSISDIQREILEDISELTPKERYDYIIDQGYRLKSMGDELKTDDRLVPGCVSRVWLVSNVKEGRLEFTADSDSIFVRGMVALILKMYSDHTPDEILQSNLKFLVESGLMQTLSATRSNGAASVMRRILRDATEAKNAHLKAGAR